MRKVYFVVEKENPNKPLNFNSKNEIIPHHEFGIFDTFGWRSESHAQDFINKNLNGNDELTAKPFFCYWSSDTYTFKNYLPFDETFILRINHPRIFNHHDLWRMSGRCITIGIDEAKEKLKQLGDIVRFNEEEHEIIVTFRKGQRTKQVYEILKELF